MFRKEHVVVMVGLLAGSAMEICLCRDILPNAHGDAKPPHDSISNFESSNSLNQDHGKIDPSATPSAEDEDDTKIGIQDEEEWSDGSGPPMPLSQLSNQRLSYIARNLIGVQNLYKHPKFIVELKRRGLVPVESSPAPEIAEIKQHEFVHSDVQKQIDARVKLVDDFVDSVRKSSEDAARNTQIQRLNDDSRDIEFWVNKSQFESYLWAFRNNPKKQGQLLWQRATDLLDAQKRASAIGRDDFARVLNNEALTIASRLADKEGFRAQGAYVVGQAVKARKSLNDKLINQVKEKQNSN